MTDTTELENPTITKPWVNFWNEDIHSAPPNTRIIVSVSCRDTWGTYDPTWGKGRGGWFNDKGQAIKPTMWVIDTEAYLAQRPKGPNIMPIV